MAKNSVVGLARGLLDARRGARHGMLLLLCWLGSSSRASPGSCVQLALSRRLEFCSKGSRGLLPVWTGRYATRRAMGWVGRCLPDGARAPEGLRGASVRMQVSESSLYFALAKRERRWWLVAAPLVDAPAADVNPPTRLSTATEVLALVFNLTRPTSRPGTRGRGAPRTPRRT